MTLLQKEWLYGLLFGLLLLGLALGFRLWWNSPPAYALDSFTLEQRFTVLSQAHSNECSQTPAALALGRTDGRIQGSCCGAMDLHRYTEQVEGLKKYASTPKIPPDPYDIPVSLAQEFLSYQKTITLTPDQQAIYDQAVKLSHEGGPCCCKCWRWYAFEGLAKYLITEHGFIAEQIADIWDLEDGCGGTGHTGHGADAPNGHG